MPRSRSRSKSKGRVDPVRRACQLRRFHCDLQAKHPYKKDLIAKFDADTIAAIDLLIGEGVDWQVVPDGEAKYDPNWRKKPHSLSSVIVWIKKWAKDVANDQEHVDGGDGPAQAAVTDAGGTADLDGPAGGDREQAVATDDGGTADLDDPAGGDREQAVATDAGSTANLDGPDGFSANPSPPLWNLQAGDEARNTLDEGLKTFNTKPLDRRPSNAGPPIAGPPVSKPLNTAAGKPNNTEPLATRLQNAQMHPPLPVHSRPKNERPRSSFQFPTNARESFGSEAIGALPQHTSSIATPLSTAVREETLAEIQERRREKDLARKREENVMATAAYDEIPQTYLDWLLAHRDASQREKDMEEAEEQCEAAQARVELERDALDVATRELEGAKSAVTSAKRQRFELAMGRESGHHGAVLDRDAGATNDDAPLPALRSNRKQRAEAYNTALERCTAAAEEHAAAYGGWVTARDAYQEAEVLEEQRKRAWEQLRGVRRGDVGR